MANIGERVGKQYILEKEIESGAVQTFLGRDTNNNTLVLVRVLKVNMPDDKGNHAFQQLCTLKHRSLEKPLATGTLDPTKMFMVVPQPEGMTLSQLIPKNEGLTLTEMWPLFHQIADALKTAHKQGVRNFDLDPAHIHVAYDDDDNEVVQLRWLGPDSQENDIANLRKLVAFMLEGKEPSEKAIAAVSSRTTHLDVQAFADDLSEIHRKQILVVSEKDGEELSENVVDSSLGRFMIVSGVITLIGCTLLLYYWLTSST